MFLGLAVMGLAVHEKKSFKICVFENCKKNLKNTRSMDWQFLRIFKKKHAVLATKNSLRKFLKIKYKYLKIHVVGREAFEKIHY